MNKFVLVFLCPLFVLAAVSPADAAGGWVQLKNEDGIKSYERPVPGTKLKEFMAVTVIDAKMEVIGEALRDVPAYPKWITDCSTARVEKLYDRNTMVIYMALEPPIIKERDLVLKDKAVYDWDHGNATISFATTNEVNVPPRKGCVRLETMRGVYDMEYLGRGKTKFVYRLLVDPNVSFPVTIGMSYSVMKNYPFKTLKALKTLVQDRKYAEAARGTEEEKGIDARAHSEEATKTIFIHRLQQYVKDKAALKAIVDADRSIVRGIVSTGSSYESNRQATSQVYLVYLDKVVADKNLCARIRGDKAFSADLIDMVETECGADGRTVESVMEEYRIRYAN